MPGLWQRTGTAGRSSRAASLILERHFQRHGEATEGLGDVVAHMVVRLAGRSYRIAVLGLEVRAGAGRAFAKASCSAFCFGVSEECDRLDDEIVGNGFIAMHVETKSTPVRPSPCG
jgi:hypothetical protein